ncbi:hypothetical protein [Spiroplasma eriocheiris]|uniref:Uncharacterized protein n=1 Tax=Spiroplasma eriocheiris TaxID=315358 RepID=A0A0H3XH41_9MOLU|nr:hypothetical protein [Spiroplasma eriocheiris]AHF57447.1 hypothetical protein SPE_0318 [Spiroplasma eriocheiris CCTCC M 207170]AKM53903.1 hypothetical protein SERIO_v1c03210 [Spiroplasma eriocheiris]
MYEKNDITLENSNLNNIWNGVGIKHSIATPAAGTHDTEDTQTATKATAKINWEDIISQSNFVNANGYFALHPYDNAKYYNIVELKFNAKESTKNLRVWNYSETNDQWAGWDHQTSKIDLTLKAAYNDDEGITALELIS